MKDMHNTGRTLGSMGGKGLHSILMHFHDVCSLGGEAAGQSFSVICEKLSSQYTAIFPTGAAQLSKCLLLDFFSPLQSREDRKKMLQFPFPWYLSQTTTWTPTSPHFTLLHLCPNKPFILQKATAGEVYLHSPLTEVSSYLTACAPKCP